MLYNLHFTG